MSATGRGERGGDGRDFFPTPLACTTAIASILEIRPGDRVLEPSAGSGNVIQGILDVHGVRAHAVEINREQAKQLEPLAASVWCGSLLNFGLRPEQRGWDWIVGNPPYGVDAKQHIRHCLYLLRPGGRLCFLLRAGYLHPFDRRPTREGLWATYGLEERPSFYDSTTAPEDGEAGSDASEYAAFVWQRGYTGSVRTAFLSWKDAARRDQDVARIRAVDWTDPQRYPQGTSRGAMNADGRLSTGCD